VFLSLSIGKLLENLIDRELQLGARAVERLLGL
jgi:hypothetical protein